MKMNSTFLSFILILKCPFIINIMKQIYHYGDSFLKHVFALIKCGQIQWKSSSFSLHLAIKVSYFFILTLSVTSISKHIFLHIIIRSQQKMKHSRQEISINPELSIPKQRKMRYCSPPLALTPQMLQKMKTETTPIKKLTKNKNNGVCKTQCVDLQQNRYAKAGYDGKKHTASYKTLTNEQNIQNQFMSAEDYMENLSNISKGDFRITLNQDQPNLLNNLSHPMSKFKRQQGLITNSISNSNYEINFNHSSVTPKKPQQNCMIKSEKMHYVSNNLRDKDYKMNGVKANPPSLTLRPQKLSLQQVVKDLESHNKNIMKETKKTVQDFEAYIKQLLQSNVQMQTNLVQYESYIQMLENERLQVLDREKQRQIILQKIIREKLQAEEKLKNIKESTSESPPSILKNIQEIQSENKKKQEEIFKLKQQVLSKEEKIALLEQLVAQKEGAIKNMANFNNEMCLELIELKNNRNLTICNANELKNGIKSKFNHKGQLKSTLQQKLNQLYEENGYLRKKNEGIEKEIILLLMEDQRILKQIEKQSLKIQFLQSKVLNLIIKLKKCKDKQGKSEEVGKSDMSCSINLKRMQYQVNEANNKQIQRSGKLFRNKSCLAQSHGYGLESESQQEIQKLDRQFEAYLIEESSQNENNLQERLVLRKIDGILQILCGKLKITNKKQKYKDSILNIMRTLTEISDESTQIEECSHADKFKKLLKSSSNLHKDQGQAIFQSKRYLNGRKSERNLMDHSMANIKQKNEEILQKIQQMKRKVKLHIMQPNLNERAEHNKKDLEIYKDCKADNESESNDLLVLGRQKSTQSYDSKYFH